MTGRGHDAGGSSPGEDGLPWVHDANMALLVDQYELTMLAAYHAQDRTDEAVFSLFVRRLPPERNFLLAAGLSSVLSFLERLRFGSEALAYLQERPEFGEGFTGWLAGLRFTGDVWGVPEGTPVFANEPILEVRAPLPEAQLVETFVMNQIHLQTVLASKAARVKLAAGDRAVVDFGIRRMHGTDAALKSARAFHIAGVDATSNVLAGQVHGVPVTGTMAHSYIQSFDDELEAFRRFLAVYPDTVLLVDTYDTLEGVRKVVALAEELGDGFQVRGIRLDSGDLGELARGARSILDEAGLEGVEIFASGGLDEWSIRALVRSGAPIDGFGVGTGMGVSSDAPSLDLAYKLTEYAGKGRVKLSSSKPILPGLKQVFRMEEEGRVMRDVLARHEEDVPGRPLLRKGMEGGRRTASGKESLEDARRRARAELARLPGRVLALETAEPPFEVEVSQALEDYQARVIADAAGPRGEGGAPVR